MKVYLFPCIEKNIGDDLFVKILCERYPDVEFIISSKAMYGSLREIPNLTFSNKLERWNWLSSLGQNNKVKACISKVLQFLYKFRLPKFEIAVSIVGNAFKNEEYKGWKQSRWIRERMRLADKFYLLSTNFGPYKHKEWKDDFHNIFSSMTDVCFRDLYSYNLFSDLPNVRFAPDAVFSLGMHSHEKNKNVIISLIDCSFEARSQELKKATYSYEKKTIEIIKYLRIKGYTITLLNSNMEQDRPACNRILANLEEGTVSVIDYNGDLTEVFAIYEQSSYIIGTRLHTIVLGWLYGLKVLPIVYDIKVSNLLKSCSYDGEKAEITDLESITAEQIVSMMENNNYMIPKTVLSESQKQFDELDKKLMYKEKTI